MMTFETSFRVRPLRSISSQITATHVPHVLSPPRRQPISELLARH